MVPVDDTALAVTDTGGPGIPVVYLNGEFATQSYWRRVVADLGTGWRHITYDERARGKSKRSADYSFKAAVGDVDAVLAARSVDRALLVGWSYGAYVAAHWASRNPDRALGPVLDNITVPVRYVIASGTSFGSRGDEQEQMRTSVHAVTARNPNIKVSAKVASNHGAILKSDAPAIAEAVREVADAVARAGEERPR
jgi:pimeloyl-ACP methyl ester carboxylesterase